MARNTGFALAKGKYTAFPDIDDVIHPQMYSRLLQIALAGQLDVATCNGTYVYEDGGNPGRFSRPVACVPRGVSPVRTG